MQTLALPLGHEVKFQAPAEPAFVSHPQFSTHSCNLRSWPSPFMELPTPRSCSDGKEGPVWVQKLFSLMQIALLEHHVTIVLFCFSVKW